MQDEDYDEYDEQQIGPDDYAYFCYQQGHVDQVDHADPANYDPLDALIDALVMDLLIQELIYS